MSEYAHDDGRLKQMSWAYIMCIFLGCWGVHRFYLGRPLTGILYLFTGGLFLVGVIWDLLIGIPAMVAHQNGRDY